MLGVSLATIGGCSAGKAAVDAAATATFTKIDDMEDGGNRTEWAPSGLLPGLWWTTTDCTEAINISPVQTGSDLNSWSFAAGPYPLGDISGSRQQERRALPNHGGAAGPANWGAEMGFDVSRVLGSDAGVSLTLTPDGGVVDDIEGCPLFLDHTAITVDLGGYSGITFWAMANPAGVQTILVSLNDRNTDPRGGICDATDPTSAAANCFNEFSIPVTLTNTFARYTIDFSALQQNQTWGYRPNPDVPDLQHVFGFSFAVYLPVCAQGNNTTCAGAPPSVSFDFWIDDIYLVNR